MTKSKIEWTDRIWKPVKIVDGVATLDASQLTKPLQWRKPKRCFVGDPFAKGLSSADIDKVFAVMALAPHITFQILTKRPSWMLGYCVDLGTPIRIASEIMHDNFPVTGKQSLLPLGRRAKEEDPEFVRWPISNVWLGVSVHDQDSADEFVPLLLDTPAALRFVSYEPALGLVDWFGQNNDGPLRNGEPRDYTDLMQIRYGGSRIDWIIAGGESGPNARPPHPDWIRQTRDQCAEAGTAFYFNGWGEWMVHVDESAVGNQLDGRTHQAFPDLIVI